jgi:hypothetical protein
MTNESNEAKAAGADLGMDAFFTRDRANEGLQLPLYLPNGEKSGHWVRVLGIDSDVFRLADTETRRDAFRIAQIEDKRERSLEIAASKRRLIATLVVAWSFPQPCTQRNVEEFFGKAPQIMDAIDQAASRRALFFAARSSSSQPTPSDSSSST